MGSVFGSNSYSNKFFEKTLELFSILVFRPRFPRLIFRFFKNNIYSMLVFYRLSLQSMAFSTIEMFLLLLKDLYFVIVPCLISSNFIFFFILNRSAYGLSA